MYISINISHPDSKGVIEAIDNIHLVFCAKVWSKSEVMLPISEKLNTAQLASAIAQALNFPRYY